MISVCWTCGGTGDYLEGNENRAIECFGCQVLREVDEADPADEPSQRKRQHKAHMKLVDVVAEFEHTRPRHHGSVTYAAPILGYANPKSLAKALYRARNQGIDIKFTDDVKQVSA